jgi:hypothetical protein
MESFKLKTGIAIPIAINRESGSPQYLGYIYDIIALKIIDVGLITKA